MTCTTETNLYANKRMLVFNIVDTVWKFTALCYKCFVMSSSIMLLHRNRVHIVLMVCKFPYDNICVLHKFVPCIVTYQVEALLWRHNGRYGISNHQPHDCLLNRLFWCRSKKTWKLHWPLCGEFTRTGEFPAHKWPVTIDDAIMGFLLARRVPDRAKW